MLLSNIISDRQDFNAPLCAGDYYFRRRRFGEALHEYFKADSGYMLLLGHKFFLRSKLAEVLIAQHLFREAADIVSALRAEDPEDTDIIALYAKLLLADDNFSPQQLDALIANLTSALTRAPDKYDIELELGSAYARKNDSASIELARKHLEKGLGLRPDSILVRSALAQLLLRNKDYSGALALSKEVLKVDPENSDVQNIQSESVKGLVTINKTQSTAPPKGML